MAEQADCLICFCPIEDFSYTCGDPLCMSKTCHECTEALINYSEGEQVIPKCPSEKCNSYYLLSGLKTISNETLKKYNKACLDYMLKDKGEKVQKKMEQDKILERLRKERMQFIQENFPPAIALVATLTFGTKMRRLEKQRTQAIAEKMNASHRICMNLYCNGHLDDTLTCMTCTTKFCQKCEKILKDGHKCRKEDIDSIEMINDMIHCPECKLPVFKDVGCDSITCSNCNTLFKYSTGERGGHGSSNAKIQLEVKRKLSFMYREELNDDLAVELLLQIESKEPPVLTETGIMNAIKLLYQTKDTEKAAKQLAKRLDAYMRNKYDIRNYQHTLGEVEELLQKKELTIEQLTMFIDRLDGKL